MNSSTVKRRLFYLGYGAIGQANINAQGIHSLMLPILLVNHQLRFAEIIKTAPVTLVAAAAISTTSTALTGTRMSRLMEIGA